MISLVFIVVFVLCFAIAVMYVLIGHEMANNYKDNFFRLYLYYLIAFNVFSVYAIWGQIGIQTLLTTVQNTGEIEELIGTFISILGTPFLIISMVMFIQMGFALIDGSKKNNTLYLFLILLLLVPIIVGAFYFENKESTLSIESVPFYIVVLVFCIEFIQMLVFVGIVIKYIKKVRRESQKIIWRFAILLFVGLVLRGVSLIFYFVELWALAPLILLYFLSHLMALWYLRGQSDNLFKPISAERPNTMKKNQLYQKYGITAREREVIEQLCLGKTNQQIADTLFISLQTVKDHTHRIYNKVGINSRMKLVQMIND